LEENLFEIIKDFSREKGLDHEVVIKLVEESLFRLLSANCLIEKLRDISTKIPEK